MYSIVMDVTVTRHIAETEVKDQPREDDERDRRSMEGAIRRSRKGGREGSWRREGGREGKGGKEK